MKCLLMILVLAGTLAGCQAERPVIEPIEPDWSYHDGGELQSSFDWKAWNQERLILRGAIQTVENY